MSLVSRFSAKILLPVTLSTRSLCLTLFLCYPTAVLSKHEGGWLYCMVLRRCQAAPSGLTVATAATRDGLDDGYSGGIEDETRTANENLDSAQRRKVNLRPDADPSCKERTQRARDGTDKPSRGNRSAADPSGSPLHASETRNDATDKTRTEPGSGPAPLLADASRSQSTVLCQAAAGDDGYDGGGQEALRSAPVLYGYVPATHLLGHGAELDWQDVSGCRAVGLSKHIQTYIQGLSACSHSWR